MTSDKLNCSFLPLNNHGNQKEANDDLFIDESSSQFEKVLEGIENEDNNDEANESFNSNDEEDDEEEDEKEEGNEVGKLMSHSNNSTLRKVMSSGGMDFLGPRWRLTPPPNMSSSSSSSSSSAKLNCHNNNHEGTLKRDHPSISKIFSSSSSSISINNISSNSINSFHGSCSGSVSSSCSSPFNTPYNISSKDALHSFQPHHTLFNHHSHLSPHFPLSPNLPLSPYPSIYSHFLQHRPSFPPDEASLKPQFFDFNKQINKYNYHLSSHQCCCHGYNFPPHNNINNLTNHPNNQNNLNIYYDDNFPYQSSLTLSSSSSSSSSCLTLPTSQSSSSSSFFHDQFQQQKQQINPNTNIILSNNIHNHEPTNIQPNNFYYYPNQQQQPQQQQLRSVSDRNRKRLYRIGLNIFNKQPEKGIEFLIKHKFVESHPRMIARFLISRKGLSRKMIGKYLGIFNKNNKIPAEVLRYFSEELDLTGLHIDVALRLFQSQFQIAGEAQMIERFMQVFSNRYCDCNCHLVGKIFKTIDTVFLLSFATMMLNTDLHNKNIKPDKRMTCLDFIKNLKGLDDGKDINSDYLSGIYERVKGEEFSVLGDHLEQVGVLDQMITINH